MRWVVYVDMDAFYLSCELTRHPEARGQPALVAHDPKGGKGRGVVLSASYEARSLGFRSAMPVKEAWRMRELATWFPPDFALYEEISEKVVGVLRERSDLVRSFSIDEAAYPWESPTGEEVREEGRTVQRMLRVRLGLPSSIGIATDLSLAKIASDKAKPGGVLVIAPPEARAFLSPLPVRALPGIGPVTARHLKSIGVERVSDLAALPDAQARKLLGAFSRDLLALARGAPRPAAWPEEEPPRSYGSMITFDEDLGDEPALQHHLADLATGLARQVERKSQQFRTVTVRLRWDDFANLQRSHTLPHPVSGRSVIEAEARGLLHDLLNAPERGKRGVRTLGLTVQDLRPADRSQRTLDPLS